MIHHLRALNVPVAGSLLALLVGGLAALVGHGQEVALTSPAVVTAAAPALVAVVSAVVLRGPLGPLAQTTVRSGLSAAWLSGLLLWAVGTLAVVGAAMSLDSRLVEPSLRSSVGCAALAVLGAIAAGPNLATALVLGWLMLTALLSAQANAAWWMWNLPVTGGATTACAVCVVAVAGLAVGWWWIRNPVPALHGRR